MVLLNFYWHISLNLDHSWNLSSSGLVLSWSPHSESSVAVLNRKHLDVAHSALACSQSFKTLPYSETLLACVHYQYQPNPSLSCTQLSVSLVKLVSGWRHLLAAWSLCVWSWAGGVRDRSRSRSLTWSCAGTGGHTGGAISMITSSLVFWNSSGAEIRLVGS